MKKNVDVYICLLYSTILKRKLKRNHNVVARRFEDSRFSIIILAKLTRNTADQLERSKDTNRAKCAQVDSLVAGRRKRQHSDDTIRDMHMHWSTGSPNIIKVLYTYIHMYNTYTNTYISGM